MNLAFKAHCEQRNAESYHGDQMPDVVELIERMHKAGAR